MCHGYTIQIKTAWLLDGRTEDWDGYIRTMGYILEQTLPTTCVSLKFLYRHRLSGMDMTLCDYDGRTALHLAAAEGHLECVAFLLEHCHVPHDPKDRSVPSQNARPLLSLLNMEHCKWHITPKIGKCHLRLQGPFFPSWIWSNESVT